MTFAMLPLLVHVFLRLFLGSLVFCSGITKVFQPQRAVQAVREYQIVPAALQNHVLATTLAGGLWMSELLAGLGLISGILLFPAALLTICLFIVFSGAMGINLARGRRDLSCHCGGALGDHRISWWLVGRNGLFLVATVLLIGLPTDPFALDHWPLPALTAWLTVVLPLFLLVGVTLLLTVLSQALHSLLHT